VSPAHPWAVYAPPARSPLPRATTLLECAGRPWGQLRGPLGSGAAFGDAPRPTEVEANVRGPRAGAHPSTALVTGHLLPAEAQAASARSRSAAQAVPASGSTLRGAALSSAVLQPPGTADGRGLPRYRTRRAAPGMPGHGSPLSHQRPRSPAPAGERASTR